MALIFTSFCENGFECLLDVTDMDPKTWNRQQAFNEMAGEESKPNPLASTINGARLRARLNPDRRYGVYIFKTAEGVELDDVKAWAEADPQGAADWIRKNYSMKFYESVKYEDPVIK